MISTAPDASRDAVLHNTLDRYYEDVPGAVIRVVRDRVLGHGWMRGLEGFEEFDFVHLFGDDAWLEPDAVDAAIRAQLRDVIPAPRVLWPDGRLQSTGWSWECESEPGTEAQLLLTYFLTPEQVRAILPLPPLTLHLDVIVTDRLKRAGYRIEYVPGFCYRHMLIGASHDVERDDALYAMWLEGGDASLNQESVLPEPEAAPLLGPSS